MKRRTKLLHEAPQQKSATRVSLRASGVFRPSPSETEAEGWLAWPNPPRTKTGSGYFMEKTRGLMVKLPGTNASSALDVQVCIRMAGWVKWCLLLLAYICHDKTNSPSNADENMKMTDCYYEKKDWRQCKEEVRLVTGPFRAERQHLKALVSLTLTSSVPDGDV